MSNNYPDWTRNESDMAALYWKLYFDIIFEEDAIEYNRATDPYYDDGAADAAWGYLQRMIAVRDTIKAAVSAEDLEAARPGKEVK